MPRGKKLNLILGFYKPTFFLSFEKKGKNIFYLILEKKKKMNTRRSSSVSIKAKTVLHEDCRRILDELPKKSNKGQ